MSGMTSLLIQAVNLRLLRTLDLQFAKLVADDSQPARLLVAACLSAAAGEGHVCLPLSQLNRKFLFKGRNPFLAQTIWQLAGAPQKWYAVFKGWSALGLNNEIVPIILDNDRLYLHRFWQYEGEIVRFFQTQSTSIYFSSEQIRSVLNQLFGIQRNNWQKIAVAVALTNKVSVISGGPGTGKTTTVAKLLSALISLSKGALRIQMTAPTGKAATRLTELLNKVLQDPKISRDNAALYNPIEATTLHRLLGAQQGTHRFRYHANNHLHLDVLVVDEASMVDLSMMANLINALPPWAKVIFLGDHDQLASVEAGAILGDICRYAKAGYSPEYALELSTLTQCTVPSVSNIHAPSVRNSICLLRKSYRFDNNSGIGKLARAVNVGNIKNIESVLKADFTDITFRLLTNNENYQIMIEEIVKGYLSFLQLITKQAEPMEIISSFSRYQVLCALREGPFGVQGLNNSIEKKLMQLKLIQKTKFNSDWYQGRPVMVNCNDNVLKLFNGDIGITLYDSKGILKVFFLQTNGTIKKVQTSCLPTHETSWAMTVHKSQGSEFDHTALVMPLQLIPVLTRELIYTAITRARKHLTLYGEYKNFCHAVQLHTQRHSGLFERFNKTVIN